MRESKIDQLDYSLGIQQHVLELQIAMRDAGEVAIVDAVEHLAEEVARVVFRHCIRAAVDHLIKELAAARELHEDEIMVLVLAIIASTMAAHTDDVTVLEDLEDVALLLDRFHPNLARVENFNCEMLTSVLCCCGESRTIATLAILLGEVHGEPFTKVLVLVGVAAEHAAEHKLGVSVLLAFFPSCCTLVAPHTHSLPVHPEATVPERARNGPDGNERTAGLSAALGALQYLVTSPKRQSHGEREWAFDSTEVEMAT
mmetsp:Transcript_20656/g.52603  ORF Transcript_20656/g.52603 Transcript_20656/m.52603 type:complete len:257 (+) Transcript_20656:990-1760(+)